MTRAAAPATWPAGDGEMAKRVRDHDWASTPLGPSDHWPVELKAAVALVLDAFVPGRQPVQKPDRVVIGFAPPVAGSHQLIPILFERLSPEGDLLLRAHFGGFRSTSQALPSCRAAQGR